MTPTMRYLRYFIFLVGLIKVEEVYALPSLGGLTGTSPTITEKTIESIQSKRLQKVLESCLKGKEVDLNAIPEKGYSVLLIALQEKAPQMKLLSYLLAHGGKINAPVDEEKNTLLLWAAMMNNTNLIRYLVKRGAYVQASNNEGFTALHWAALHNNSTAVKLLLSQGANVNAKDNNNATPLHWASQHNAFAVIRHLIRKQADINATTNSGSKEWQVTPLCSAIKHGNTRVVKALLQQGAQIGSNKPFEEAIAIAIRGNKQGILKQLLSKGLKPKKKYLLLAVQEGHAGMIKELLKHGGNPNCKNEKGECLLLITIEKKNLPAAKALVEGGAKIDITLTSKENVTDTILHRAISQSPEIALYLLSKGAKPYNPKEGNSLTPLQLAVLHPQSPKLVKALLQHGANVHDKGGEDMSTALHCAMLLVKPDIMQILVQHGAKFDIEDQSGETPFQWGSGYIPTEQVAPFKSYAAIRKALLVEKIGTS